MIAEWWSWALTLVGATCFILAGGIGTRKVWWAWYIGLAGQILWLAYSLLSQQWGFLAGVAIYSAVYIRNAVKWTRERFPKREPEVVGHVNAVIEDVDGVRLVGTLSAEVVRARHFMPTTQVQLKRPDHYLREYHNVIPNETIGKVINWSYLASDDFGVLVDWGDGNTVRADVDEIRGVHTPEVGR